jgi:hypothetical protein
LRPGEEQVVFYENPRDPEINTAMAAACAELNHRKLERNGRRLLFRVEEVRAGQIPTSIPFG